jgi:hypothetical protein
MQKYQNNIVSSSGTPVISASISVTNYPSGTAATIYSDNGVTLATNPLTSDSLGNFSFYAADGRYSLSISGVNVSATTLTDILLEDPTNPNPISATTITATGTSTLAGVTATSLAVSGAATVGAGLAVTGALSATGALTTNGLKEDSSGNFAVGGATSSSATLAVSKNITGAAFAAGTRVTSIVQPDVTSRADIFQAVAAVAAGTYNTVIGYQAQQGTITGTLTNQIGFSADPSLVGATNNYGFYGNIPAGTGRYNFYANGTAPNYFGGQTTINTSGSGQTLVVSDTGANGGNIQIKGNGATTSSKTIRVNAGQFQILNDAYSAVILVLSDAGSLLIPSPTGSLGYGTGAGGTVTQATSRSTAVTINKPTGAITLFSAAGVPTWTTFTVNNSLVSFADTVVLSVQSGATNAYLTSVINVANGSFTIAFATTGGVATDSPNINFAIIKGATA